YHPSIEGLRHTGARGCSASKPTWFRPRFCERIRDVLTNRPCQRATAIMSTAIQQTTPPEIECSPEDGWLEGWLRTGNRLAEIGRMAGFVSPRLGIRFEPAPGPNNLTILGPDGAPFLTYGELMRRARSERERANAAEQRADAAEERAARMAAKL